MKDSPRAPRPLWSSSKRLRFLAPMVCFFFFAHALFAEDPSAAALIEQGHYKRAQAILQSALQQNPNNARCYAEMSKVSEAFDRWDESIKEAEKAVSLDRKDPESQSALADAIGSKLSGAQIGMFEKLSLARRFKKEAELALKLDPNNLDASQDLMEFHLDAPGILGGDKKKAAELADRMVQNNPVRGYLMKFELAMHEKKTGELEPLLKQALDADPKSYVARIQAAEFYLGQGSTGLQQAEDQAMQAIRISPDAIRGYAILASVFVRQSRWRELESVLADAQRRVPDDLAPFFQAAESILAADDSHELPRAQNYMQTYLSQPREGDEPTLAVAHWRLGIILEKEGNKQQARQELQQAVHLDPKLQAAKKDLERISHSI